jgi:hypothetical protein
MGVSLLYFIYPEQSVCAAASITAVEPAQHGSFIQLLQEAFIKPGRRTVPAASQRLCL